MLFGDTCWVSGLRERLGLVYMDRSQKGRSSLSFRTCTSIPSTTCCGPDDLRRSSSFSGLVCNLVGRAGWHRAGIFPVPCTPGLQRPYAHIRDVLSGPVFYRSVGLPARAGGVWGIIATHSGLSASLKSGEHTGSQHRVSATRSEINLLDPLDLIRECLLVSDQLPKSLTQRSFLENVSSFVCALNIASTGIHGYISLG